MTARRLENKAAVLSGGAAGIGAATARLFAREGARLAILDVDAAAGRRLCDEIAASGGDAVFIRTDVTREDEVREAVETAVDRLERLDVVFNNAGGSSPDDSHVTDVDLALWETTMSLNVLGTILLCRHAIPHLIGGGGGSVVNMSSGAALRGGSPKHIYTAAKGAVVALTRALAGAYARDNVRVNAICSGRVLTERILSTVGAPGEAGPMVDRQDATGRVRDYPFWVGRPADIASIALFLACEESRMVTGASIPADGGRSAY